MKRINTLDYLRGLCALGIMVYHYIMFGMQTNQVTYTIDVDNFLERIAIYGVSIFYILSGLTLYLVYREKDFSRINNIKSFFKKRFLRIYPLFIAVTLITFFISFKDISWNAIVKLILNVSGLFSVLSWNSYFITGGWSIGNELSFYLLFPLLMFFIRNNRIYFYTLVGVSFFFYCYFAYFIISPDLSLAENWKHYVNPLNQSFLFVSGIILGHYCTAQHSTAQHSTAQHSTAH